MNYTASSLTSYDVNSTHFDKNNLKDLSINSKIIEIVVHYKDDTILNAISVLDCLIIIVGTIGNLTSFYLLTRKGLRPVSSMRYLASLTIVDTICLYGWYLSSVYKQLYGEQIKRLENFSSKSCKFMSYISFTSLQLSSILMCLLTIDRFLIIVSSFWRTKFANPTFANRFILAAVIFVGMIEFFTKFFIFFCLKSFFSAI